MNKPTLAPAWVSLLAAWVGALAMISSIVLRFLPGSIHPRQELQHLAPYSAADRFLPIPVYAAAIAMFMGLIVLWQMRKESRPLPDALVAQRLQACVAIALAILATGIVYTWVALHGPR